MTSARPWKPLAGRRIIDLCWMLSGPMVSAFLGELGAEVIKIESMKRTDLLRLRGALHDGKMDWTKGDSVPIFHWTNHGKLSVGINLKDQAGVALLKALIHQSDALVENFRVGTLERLGLSDEVLRETNPNLIRLSMTAAGRNGALSGMRGYAGSTSALGGLEASVGYPSEPSRPVGMLTFGLADYTAGAMGAFALVAALAEKNGGYRSIDGNQVEATTMLLGAGFAALAAHLPIRPGNQEPLFSPAGIYQTSDKGFVALSIQSDSEWLQLSGLLNIAEPALRSRVVRVRRRAYVDGLVVNWMKSHDRNVAVAILSELDLRVAPVLTMPERLEHSAFSTRNTDSTITMTDHAQVRLPRMPWRVRGAPTVSEAPGLRHRGPHIAEDTEHVCRNILGLSQSEVLALATRGIIDLPPSEPVTSLVRKSLNPPVKDGSKLIEKRTEIPHG